MNKIYSLLSSTALLFSLPALAAPLAAKAIESKGKTNASREKSFKDRVSIEKGPRIDGSAPICRGGGGV